MTEVNEIASVYLAELTKVVPPEEFVYDHEGPQMILRRSTAPEFFVGFVSGREVWSHEEKYAQRMPRQKAQKMYQRLGSDEVYPIWGSIAQ